MSESNQDARASKTAVILDFISKCLYPGLLAVLLILLAPTIWSIDLGHLIERLKLVKAGDVEMTFNEAQDVGAELAPLNSRVATLELELASLRKRGGPIASAGAPAMSAAERSALEARKVNAEYTALVFHRRESRARGGEVFQSLLSSGYSTSDTETDFSELQKISPRENLIFITYTDRGEKVVREIEAQIKKATPSAEIKLNPRSLPLRRGDVQIMVF